jgi:hypothetical protein
MSQEFLAEFAPPPSSQKIAARSQAFFPLEIKWFVGGAMKEQSLVCGGAFPLLVKNKRAGSASYITSLRRPVARKGKESSSFSA